MVGGDTGVGHASVRFLTCTAYSGLSLQNMQSQHIVVSSVFIASIA